MAGTTSLRSDLLELVPSERRVNDGESVRRLHGEPYNGIHAGQLPDIVVFAETEAEVSAVLAYASRERIPVVSFGAGTSAEGGTIPLQGGISLDLSGLNSIEIRTGDLQATVGAGATRKALNARAQPEGLFFSVDPGADASLGGMVATNASGTTAVRYGSMRQNVLELRVALADGRIIRAGSRTVKMSAGYNLAHIFIGSEGTLGVVTEVTVRLHGIPEHLIAVRAAFPDLLAACRCATGLVGAGLAVTRVELLDAATIAAINAYKGSEHLERPHLFLELGGSQGGVEADLELAREMAEDEGCEAWSSSSDHVERNRLWEARHEVMFAVENAHLGKSIKGTDTCVPLSQLPGAVEAARTIMLEQGFEPSVVGHVGDGNYHAMCLVDVDDPEEMARMKKVNDGIVHDALSRGGTCSGELGIGIGKIGYLAEECADSLPIMRDLKHMLDPNGILNPGKLFAPDSLDPGSAEHQPQRPAERRGEQEEA